jgi:hypothetical protein
LLDPALPAAGAVHDLIAHDAGAMATAYGAALNKLRTGNLFDPVNLTAYRGCLAAQTRLERNPVQLHPEAMAEDREELVRLRVARR